MKKNRAVYLVPAAILMSSLLLPKGSTAQGDGKVKYRGSIYTSINTEYNKTGKLHRILFGEHYRKEWATAVDIQVLDLDSYAGGLTVLKIGGGLQTKSLRLKGANGKEYVLRSINKDPSKALVSELKNTFAEDVVQDQISSANPFAPLVVSALAKKIGILHSTPQIVYVPASPRLGNYTDEFAGTVCLLEERPSGNEADNAAFDYAHKVVNTTKMLDAIFSKPTSQVDQHSFLKARLFDMLIGDWDRHEDQWLWAAFKEQGNTVYRPIPRDRDQAFSKMDGIIPGMATKKWGIRKIQGFDDKIHDIVGLNTQAIHLDRNFINGLEWDDWKHLVRQLQDALDDKTINDAFTHLPEEIFTTSGKKIVTQLKTRRDDLLKYARDYYQFLSREVNITGTKEREIFNVTRDNNDSTTVEVYSTSPNGERMVKIYSRTFLKSETKEIRLYGLDGNDQFELDGKASRGILVRAIGGKGDDKLNDQSYVKTGNKKTIIYDDINNAGIAGSMETKKIISEDSLKNVYNRKGYRYDWFAPVQTPGYNPDDGIYIGGGFIYKKQAFGKAPYSSIHMLNANYAFSTGAYTFRYKGIFKERIGKWDLQVNAQINARNYVRNYYGLGNETEKLDTTSDYYRIRFNQVILGTALNRQLGEKHTISIGSSFQSYKVEDNEGRFISSADAKLDSTDFRRKNYVVTDVRYEFNTLDYSLYPRKGVKLTGSASYTQDLRDEHKHFIQLTAEAATYFSAGAFTMASRTGVASIIGDEYEFYQANTLGGLSNLRGYRRDRFAGKTSLYQNTELRVRVSSVNMYITKGVWGLLAFNDLGKVWMPKENSNTWHNGYGGGIWFLPFNKLAVTATYGISNEDKVLGISAGFLF